MDRTGQVAVITGAASGIGLGMARAFAAAGMKLVLADVEVARLEAAGAGLEEAGADVVAIPTDVSDAAAVEALADTSYETHGAVHVVCNNAGVIENVRPIWTYSVDDWRWVLGINVMGVVHGIHAFVPRMLEGGAPGHIVSTASVGGLISGTANGIYTASKHAVVGLMEVLQNELRARQTPLRASVLCPGPIATDIVLSDRNRPDAPELSEREQRARERFSEGLTRGMHPDEVGRIVLAGIDAGTFYIKTHPALDRYVRERFEALLDGREAASTRLSLEVDPG